MQDHEIYIIDDSQVQLILLEKVLMNQGFSIQSFTEGWKLIEAMERSKPSLIISDIDMPILDGFELLQEIKIRFDYNRVPFFFMSSKSDPSTEKRARLEGAHALIQKPFQYSSLFAAINEMLGLAKV